jgi:type III secretion protein L
MLRLNRLADDWSPVGNVVKSAEHQAMLTAEDLVHEAGLRAKQIISDAEAEYERMRQQGYDIGMATAQETTTKQLVTTTTQLRQHVGELEDRLIELVVMSVQKIVGEVGNRDRVIGLVRSGLNELLGQTKVRVEVSPTDVIHVHAMIDEIRNSQPGLEILEVFADTQAEPDSCVLRTDWNVIDASLSTQIESLRRAMELGE